MACRRMRLPHLFALAIQRSPLREVISWGKMKGSRAFNVDVTILFSFIATAVME